MEKIDFFGGLHGNFLELMLNLFVYQVDIEHNDWFSSTGACHGKNYIKSYIPRIKANHYSYFEIPFKDDDQVIEIHCNQNDLLIALTNLLVRAGDQVVDLYHLEKDTIQKLAFLPKTKTFLDDLIQEHGIKSEYPRAVIRNYFYSKFDCPEYGLSQLNTFNHSGEKITFPFDAFFDLEQLYLNLNRCAFFLNMNFYPTDRTYAIWQEFMQRNQGYHSNQRCQLAMECILNGVSMDISHFNLLEEAWLLHRIAMIFRCFNHPMLTADHMPADTKLISELLYYWKSNDK